jgi:hypothetical protein
MNSPPAPYEATGKAVLVLRTTGAGTCAACGRGLCHQHAHVHDVLTFARSDTSTGYSSYFNVLGALECGECRLEWKSFKPGD